MAQLSVLLPDDLQSWTDARVAEGLYESAGDYVRDLVRRDRAASGHEARDIAQLRVAWDEGLASGKPVDGNFDVDDIVRRGSQSLEVARKRG